MLKIHPSAKISPLADIEHSALDTDIIIGEGVQIDSFVKIKPVGGRGALIVGKGSFINSGCVLYTGNGITIGDHVLVAANCTLAPVNHEFSDRTKLICEQGFRPSKGGIHIEDDVWIGANVVMLDGVVIGRGAIVGAGAVVRGALEDYGIYAGNPLTLVGRR